MGKKLNIHDISVRMPEYSRLTPVKFVETGRRTHWEFRCLCGNSKVIDIQAAISGRCRSCGCYDKERLKKGDSGRKYTIRNIYIYRAYTMMMHRCYNKKNASYKYYGGRGVQVCDEWKGNYQSFLNWALQCGWENGLHLDKDIRGDSLLYSPNTCCWVTKKVNCRNKTKTIKYVYNGKLLPLTDICEMVGIKYMRAYGRRKRHPNMSIEDLIK